MSKTIDAHLQQLGLKAKDKVTGFEGTITCISFDLYGCIQGVLTPPVDVDSKTQDNKWFDMNRLKVSNKRTMDSPKWDNQNLAKGEHGAAEKPPSSRH